MRRSRRGRWRASSICVAIFPSISTRAGERRLLLLETLRRLLNDAPGHGSVGPAVRARLLSFEQLVRREEMLDELDRVREDLREIVHVLESGLTDGNGEDLIVLFLSI